MLKAMQATFAEAIAGSLSILFIDEINAAGSHQNVSDSNASYRRQVINGGLKQVDIAMRADRGLH
jgi:SpoVK/Ycf46/Vps4 family AAA+-type ATPase